MREKVLVIINSPKERDFVRSNSYRIVEDYGNKLVVEISQFQRILLESVGLKVLDRIDE